MNLRSPREAAGAIARIGRGLAAGAAGSWRAFAFLFVGLWRAFAFIVVGLWRAIVFSFSWVLPTLALIRFWFRRISAIVDKELRQLSRERLTLGMIVGLPLLQVVLFGYAINTDVRHLPAALIDHADTSMSRQLAGALEASQVLDFVQRSGDVGEMLEGMRRGEFRVVLYIPADFERRLSDEERPLAQLMVDGSDPTIVNATERIA